MHRKSLLTVTSLAYELESAKSLFKGITAGIGEGDRIGLVGRNGIGKSTLLRILAGQLCPSAGTVTRTGTAYYMPQVSTIQQSVRADTVLD